MDERKKILDNIIEITNENNDMMNIENIILEYSCNKYSSKKNSIYHIKLNNNCLTKKHKYNIKYKCVTCQSIHIVGVTQFIRKVQKCSYYCNLCCNQHSIKGSKCNKKDDIRHLTLVELYEESTKRFQTYDDDFKDNYFRQHLTAEDFTRISKQLISLQNGKHIVNENLDFWPIFKTNNQMLFSSVFYDKQNDMIIRANQPILKCQNCNEIWRAKTLEKFKNCYKILCNKCTLCNKTFKIRNTKNNINQTILFQSNLELKFIRWCNDHNITVFNGPNISYEFEGKKRIYRVDFKIKDILIEIKDNHIWHINQNKSGLWQAKENAAKNEIIKGVYKEYIIITPTNWIYSLNQIKHMLNKI
jgi:hypothetical protein